jgi:hypothetical protein
MDGTGRIVIRYSGTEPLARVMIEGPDGERIERMAEELARLIQGAIGTACGGHRHRSRSHPRMWGHHRPAGTALLRRVTEGERSPTPCAPRPRRTSPRFAAKEAGLKALAPARPSA